MQLFPPVKPTILVVDDSAANLTLIASLLQTEYTVKVVKSGKRALELVHKEAPDLILLDIVMPEMDGYAVCSALKSEPHTQQIPVIFLTSKSDIEDEELGLELGAVDYITRPINPRILSSRVKAHIAQGWQARTLRLNNAYLEFEVTKRTDQVVELQNVTTLALASLAETRDTDTGNHLHRTQHYVAALTMQLREHPNFKGYLTASRCQAIFKCAPLHDIGKVGIPDRILLKPGRFDPDEFKVMQTHPELGYEALTKTQVSTSDAGEFLEIAKEIVYSHHEKWDGSGYPLGLQGLDIPVSARLMALSDVYDALISRRVYKPGMNHAQARQVILESRGTHFDPDIVDAFIATESQFQEIAERYKDMDSDIQNKAAFADTALKLPGRSDPPLS